MASPCPSPLPDDIMLHIFSLLPTKYLFRLRCVSKSWKALVSLDCRPLTIKKPLPATMAGLFYRDRQENKIKFTSLESRTYVDVSSIDTPLSFLPPSLLIQHDLHIADCSNGLLLLEDSKDLYVCNPATRRWSQITKPWKEYVWRPILCFHPHCSVHFKIVSFLRGDDPGLIRVFSSDTGQWGDTIIVVTSEGIKPIRTYRGEVQNKKAGYPFVNEITYGVDLDLTFRLYNGKETKIAIDSYYNLSDEEKYYCFHQDVDEYYITKFFRFNQLSDDDKRCEIHGVFLGQSQGRLHYALISSGELHVWVLENRVFCNPGYVLKHKNTVEAILGDRMADYGSDTDLDVVAIHPDLDVIFMRFKEKLFAYHLSSANLEEICDVDGDNRAYFAYSPCFIKN